MKRKTGKPILLRGAIAWLLIAAPLHAETLDGLHLELDAMYLWPERSEVDVAVRTRSTSLGDGNFSATGLRGDIDAGPDSEFAPRFELQFRDGPWGVGLNGWWIDADGEEGYTPRSSAVGPPFPDLPGRSLDGVYVPSLSSVSTNIGDAGFYEDSAITRMAFTAESTLEVRKFDFYGLRELSNRPRSQLDLIYGVVVADFDNSRAERVRDARPSISDPGISTTINSDVHSSRADWDLSVGPLLGLQGNITRSRHRLATTVTQSFLLADVDFSTRLTTAERQKFIDGSTVGDPVTLAARSRKDREWVPVTEAKLQYLYDVTERFSVGGGGFLSVWWDTPVAPEFVRSRDDSIVFVGLMLHATYRFGAGRKAVAAAPATVVPPPAPAPEPIRQPVTSSWTVNFGLDDASLNPQTRRVLDDLVQQLKGKQEIRVRVAGYACRLGPAQYNQALSERRARAVGDYLKVRRPEADIIVEGCGESDPVVDCEGLRGDALVQCLAPNRRAEIEINAIEIVTPTD